jgi:hypothetical protein
MPDPQIIRDDFARKPTHSADTSRVGGPTRAHAGLLDAKSSPALFSTGVELARMGSARPFLISGQERFSNRAGKRSTGDAHRRRVLDRGASVERNGRWMRCPLARSPSTRRGTGLRDVALRVLVVHRPERTARPAA